MSKKVQNRTLKLITGISSYICIVMSEESIINPSSSQFVSPSQNDPDLEELSPQNDKYNALLARIEKLDLEMYN